MSHFDVTKQALIISTRAWLQSRIWRLFTEDRKVRKEGVSDDWLKPSGWLFATFAFFCCKLLLFGRPSLVLCRLALLCSNAARDGLARWNSWSHATGASGIAGFFAALLAI